MTGETLWLACGVIRDELTRLQRDGRIQGKLIFLDSLLHMNPPLLESTLREELQRPRENGTNPVLVYGDCCAGMNDLRRTFGAGRVNVINCAQLLLGKERYRELMHEEAFLVLPEWAKRWESVMADALGLPPAQARELLGEHRAVLVYLDTGIVAVPVPEMEAFSAYAGLPWRVERVRLDTALATLLEAQTRKGEET